MKPTVSAAFKDRRSVDSLVGALREASFTSDRIRVVDPEGNPVTLGLSAPAHHGVGSWLNDHLIHRHETHDETEQSQPHASEGHWVVTVEVENDTEERDARTLVVSAGADEISSASTGLLVPVVGRVLVG